MKIISILLFIISCCSIQAQYDTTYMAVMPFTSVTAQGKEFVKSAQKNAINVINLDYRIHLVDRDVSNAVEWEREYQKSEEFIDGKIVEQGKAIGADYVMKGTYDHRIKNLTISIYDVNTGELKGSIIAEKVIEQKKAKTKGMLNRLAASTAYTSYDNSHTSGYKGENGKFPSAKVVKSNVRKLLNTCFPEKGWVVLRPVDENKNKVKELLIAAGSRMKIHRGLLIEIMVKDVEEVDGIQLERVVSIGYGKVIKVENENFSILKVESGGKKIKNELTAGKKLRCRLMKK